MTERPCCGKPCPVADWVKVGGRSTFGHACTNCRLFKPADGSKPIRLHAVRGGKKP